MKSSTVMLFIVLILGLCLPSFETESTVFEGALERPEVQRALDQFLTRERDFVQRGLNNAPLYLPIVREALAEEELPAQLAWLRRLRPQ